MNGIDPAMSSMTPPKPVGRSGVWMWILVGIAACAVLAIAAYVYLAATSTEEGDVIPLSSESDGSAAAIEGDLNQMDLNGLGAELDDIDREAQSK